jgi:Patatin phospholipase
MDIVQLVYCPASTLGAAKDYEFSRAMMAAHWDQGNADAAATLKASPWLAPKPADIGVRVFDIAQTIAVEKDAKPAAVGPMEARRSNVNPPPPNLARDSPGNGLHYPKRRK